MSDPDTAAISEDEKDAHFVDLVGTDEGLTEFLDSLNVNMGMIASSSVATDIQKALDSEVAPLIKSLVFKTSEASAQAKASARGIIRANATYYRDLFSKARGKSFWESLDGDGIPADIKAENPSSFIGVSISERQNVVANRIRNRRLRDSILSGNLKYGKRQITKG